MCISQRWTKESFGLIFLSLCFHSHYHQSVVFYYDSARKLTHLCSRLCSKKQAQDWAQDAWNLILYPPLQLFEDVLFLSKVHCFLKKSQSAYKGLETKAFYSYQRGHLLHSLEFFLLGFTNSGFQTTSAFSGISWLW